MNNGDHIGAFTSHPITDTAARGGVAAGFAGLGTLGRLALGRRRDD